MSSTVHVNRIIIIVEMGFSREMKKSQNGSVAEGWLSTLCCL